MRAVAYWITTHSKRFGAHTPTRSPGFTLSASKPFAARSTSSHNPL